MRKYLVVMVPALVLAMFVLAACGSPTPPTPVPGAATATPAPAATGAEAEWQQLQEDARREGRLVIGTTASSERDMQQVFDFFSRQFGVEIISSIGSGTARMDRILAERSRGIFATDIEISGGSSMGRLVEAGATQELMPLLIDRDNVIDRSANWAVKDFLWIDAAGRYTAGYSVRADPNMAHIMYNTDKVSPAELETIQSWWDLLEPRWKGRMAAAVDPGFGGGTPQRAFTWMRLGQEWWETFMREMDVALYPPQEPRMLVDDLVRGTVDLVVHIPSNPNKADILEAAALGLPVAEFPRTLSEGSIPELYPSVSTVVNQGPNPKAAQLWMNWILSREGQTALHELVDAQEVSLRTDVPQGNVSDQMWAVRSRLIEDPSMLVNIGEQEFLTAREQMEAWLFAIHAELGNYGY